MTTAAPPCRSEGIELRPLAVDVYGQIDIRALQLLQGTSNLTASRRGKPLFSRFRVLLHTILVFALRCASVMINQRRMLSDSAPLGPNRGPTVPTLALKEIKCHRSHPLCIVRYCPIPPTSESQPLLPYSRVPKPSCHPVFRNPPLVTHRQPKTSLHRSQHPSKMVQMRTVLRVADNSGAKTVRCINILGRRRQRPSGNVGSHLVVSVTSLDRSVRSRKAKKGEVHRALVIRSKNEPLRQDGGFVRMGDTAAILLTGDGTTPMGTRIRGPVSAGLDRKKYLKVMSLARISLFSTLASTSHGHVWTRFH